MDITTLTVHELQEKIANKELCITDVIEAYINNIEEHENNIGAFITIYKDKAIKKAKELDERINKGEKLGRFSGIPIGIKDNICTKDELTTCASKMLENFISPYDATVVESLNKENIISLGKLNMDEFAMGSSTENSYFKVTKNPWNSNKVSGGSSGGAAAAVASNMIPWALGSDTGGSIRQPASFCGVVGLKPTYGLVSRYGLVAFASSLDQIGPITKDVTDCAILLNLITGYDTLDTTSVNIPKKDYKKALTGNIKGLKIGVLKEFFREGIDKEVKDKIYEVLELYKKLGASISEFSLDVEKYALPTYHIISSAEASSNLGRYDGIRYTYRTSEYKNLDDLYKKTRSEGFGSEVKRRIMLGTYVLSEGYYDEYYKKASNIRKLITNRFKEAFSKYDIICTPTTPTVAFDIGEKAKNPIEMYQADVYTVCANLAGIPAISVPCGVNKDGMPIGIQIMADEFNEDVILKSAYTIEKEIKFREKFKPGFDKGV